MKEDNKAGFDEYFKKAKGKPLTIDGRIVVRIDRLRIEQSQKIGIEILGTNSNWTQGLIMETDGIFIFENGIRVENRPVIWENTAPKSMDVYVESKNNELLIYNVWDVGNGVMQYWHNGAAMEIKRISQNKRIYYCNDGFPDSDFNDLIFSIELH